VTQETAPFIHDLAVIGGGVNGCGIARDAAGRGASVVLLERGDLAQGTSSASTKLIHGGLRYLEHRAFGLVRESLAERERLWRIAPHIIQPMRFVLPWVQGLRPRWLLRLGLFLYDHIGGRRALPATEAIDLRHHVAGAPLRVGFGPAYVYSDGWVDDARLVILNARDAADHGADIRPRTQVLRLEQAGDHWRIHARDAAGQAQTFHARVVVNATGPSVLDLLDRADRRADRLIRLVRGSHIVVPRLTAHDFSYFFQLPDGRIFFAIPYEQDFTLIGTTDRDHQGGEVQISEEEIAYLCEGASRYLARGVTPGDVVWTYSGVRPLIDDGSGKPEAATRGYRLDLSEADRGAPLLSVFGGKITTYRHLAEEAVAKLAERLPELAGKGWTADAALPGGNFPMDGAAALVERLAARFAFLEPVWVARLARTYGTVTEAIFDEAASLDDCGRHFGHGLTEREVRYLIDHEWAVTAEDILWRRTKLGLRFSAVERAVLTEWLDDEGAGE
jgi:glycerol-3-phosphate dehydrogenase